MTTFETVLRANIKTFVAQAKRNGATAMSLDCLRQCVPSPKTTDGAPRGTNAIYYYKQMFADAAKEIAPRFIY